MKKMFSFSLLIFLMSFGFSGCVKKEEAKNASGTLVEIYSGTPLDMYNFFPEIFFKCRCESAYIDYDENPPVLHIYKMKELPNSFNTKADGDWIRVNLPKPKETEYTVTIGGTANLFFRN